jgi:hypothetical protein
MTDSDILNNINSLNIITLPPAYSLEDIKRREAIYAQISAIEKEYRNAVKPLIDEMVKIDAAYPTRFWPVPR